jgi:1-phosphofructokinase
MEASMNEDHGEAWPPRSRTPEPTEGTRCTVAVLAPSPLLTVTVEEGSGAGPEVHLHAGGQGFWVSRMAVALGARAILCAPLGGESGSVLVPRIEDEGVEVRSVACRGSNAAYVHDRRSGSRATLAETRSPSLLRHEVDELYGIALTAGLDADITLLTGPRHERVLPGDFYERLAADLRTNDRPVIADLTGEPLEASLKGGLDLLKISDEEVVDAGYARSREPEQLIRAVEVLRSLGAESVLVSRGPRPALAWAGGELLELSGPRFSPLDHHGTGDSMFAAIGVALGDGRDLREALRLAVAAGALNATRRGLGSGHEAEIERLLPYVDIRSTAVR